MIDRDNYNNMIQLERDIFNKHRHIINHNNMSKLYIHNKNLFNTRVLSNTKMVRIFLDFLAGIILKISLVKA